MFTSIHKVILFSLLTTAVLFSVVQPAAAQGNGPTDPAELESFLDNYLAEQMDTYHIPGVVVTFVKGGDGNHLVGTLLEPARLSSVGESSCNFEKLPLDILIHTC